MHHTITPTQTPTHSYLWDHIDPVAQERCHFFGVFMYKMLTTPTTGGSSSALTTTSVNYAGVKRWTKVCGGVCLGVCVCVDV